MARLPSPQAGCFCSPGTNFIECWCDRGTRFLGGRVFILVDVFEKRHWRSVAVQVVSEPEICHGAGFLLGTAARIQVPD
jgi:hypothetical protein